MALARFCLRFLLTVGLAIWNNGVAHAASTEWSGDSRAAVRLITGTDSLTADATLDAGLEFRFAKGWHGYWRTPGDAGVGPVIDWSGSENILHGEVAWPAPHRLVIEGLQNSIYENRVVLPVKLFLKKTGVPVRIRVSVGYAACSDICVPYQAELTLPLLSGNGVVSAEAALINSARATVPRTLAAAGIDLDRASIGGTRSERKLVVDLRSNAEPLVQPDLFIEGTGDGIPAAPEVNLRDGGRTARLTVRLPASLPPGRSLTLTLTDGHRAAEFSVPSGPAITPHISGLLAALASALLGGLILNLMPCVLPVLSIKLFAFSRHAGGGLHEVRLGSAATAAGIVTSFILLAVVLVTLKWSGAALGWGIQFQQPWFLAGMAALTVLLAASFFEWLPIALPTSVMTFASIRARDPTPEAFLTGVFATLLATPCSAPFVGTAVGFALAQGPSEIFAIFLCLGIGMALPYWMTALFPGCVRWLPRPGPWMLVLRQLLGVLLLGTAAWLLFVLWSTAGVWIAGTTGILLACLLGYRALIKNRNADQGWHRTKIITTVLAVAPLVVGLSAASSNTSSPAARSEWQAFDPNALPGLIAEGKTVLVDVSAAWCLTCKVNDLAVLEKSDIRARLDQPGIVRMRADWSRPNPSIASYLHGFGRFGIPLDVVYGPRRPQGEVLPELLIPSILTQALNQASADSKR